MHVGSERGQGQKTMLFMVSNSVESWRTPLTRPLVLHARKAEPGDY